MKQEIIRTEQFGFVFQDFYLMDSISVKENIMLPMILDKRPDEECIQNMQKLVERFGLAHLLDKKTLRTLRRRKAADGNLPGADQ